MAEVRSPDTRERILDAAERLFMAHGYEGTSMRRCCITLCPAPSQRRRVAVGRLPG